MSYLGDFSAGDILDFKFTSRKFSTGAPHTLAGTPAISIYKSNSTTQSTSGVTLTVDFDAVTGLNHVRIDTTSDGTFYANGGQFSVVITTGTVDSVSVVGECIGRFTLRAQASLYPVTAGRTLEVGADNYASTNVKKWKDSAPANLVDTDKLPASIQHKSSSVGMSAEEMNNIDDNTANHITSNRLHQLLIAAVDLGTDIADNSLFARILSKSATATASTYNHTTDSLEALRDLTAGTLTVNVTQWRGAVPANLVDTDKLSVSVQHKANLAFSALEQSGIQSLCEDALTATKLDRLFAVSVGVGDVVNGSFGALLVSKSATPDFTTYSNITDSLEAIRDTVGGTLNANITQLLGASIATPTQPGFLPVDAVYVNGDDIQVVGSPARLSVSVHNIAANAITSSSIQNDAISPGKIAGDTITETTIASGAITSAKLAAGTITTASIADGAITDAKFTVPSITGPATGILGMVVQLWRRFFKRTRYDKSGSTIKTYANDGTTVVTTQTVVSSGTEDDVGAAT